MFSNENVEIDKDILHSLHLKDTKLAETKSGYKFVELGQGRFSGDFQSIGQGEVQRLGRWWNSTACRIRRNHR